MRAVVLQHEPVEGPGIWAEALLEMGATVECVWVAKNGVPKEAADADLLISMGGSMSVNDDLGWIGDELAVLRERILAGAPTLGVCLGSQLIARAAGGVVERGLEFEIGFREVELSAEGVADPVAGRLPRRFSVLQWHGEYFRDVPGAVPLARSPIYAMQALRVGRAYGLLFHLEATLHSIAAMSRAFPDDLRRGDVDASALLDEARRKLPEMHAHARALLEALLVP
jgi:GMP synthase (glutamine-hydrolysing)